MFTFKKLILATTTASVVAFTPLIHAEEGDLQRQLTEARHEGSVWTAIALNRHLNPFTISVDMDGSTAILTGSVESDIDRDLAEQVALGIDGVESVDNQLTVDAKPEESQKSDFSQRIEDATITATVKSKLLWNRNTEGLDIKVQTDNGVVTLSGKAESSEAKDLAQQLTRNTDGVKSVRNQLEVASEDNTDEGSTMDRAQNMARDAGDAVSDAWVTSKVKSSFLLNRNLKGRDINVETQEGTVHLSGHVDSDTEKDLATEVARNIRGVNDVDASQLNIRN